MSEGLTRTVSLVSGLPRERPCALLLRHAERRSDVTPEQLGSEEPLTAAGHDQARRLGRALAGRLVGLSTSPTLRCRQSALALREGSGANIDVHDDRLLGGPGAFVVDEVRAGSLWREWGHARVLDHLLHGQGSLPGLADPALACARLLAHLDPSSLALGVHVFVTHDSLLGPLLARHVAPALGAPDFLDALAVWRDGDALWLQHRAFVVKA